MEKQTESYVNANDVCKHLRIARSKFVQLCMEGLPRIQIGNKAFRYKLSEVEAWLKQRRAK